MAEIALIANITAFVAFVTYTRKEIGYRVGVAALLVSALALAGLLVFRSVAIAFPALTGTYEGLLLLACAMNATMLVGRERIFRRHRGALAAGALASFVYIAILSSPVVSSELFPPVPILRSYWLVLHVAFAFVGLSLLTLAAVMSLVAGFTSDPSAVDAARDRSLVVGYVFYAVGGLVFGAIWADSAWGRFWGWDPKETWALITTLLYTVYLHLRYVRVVSQRVARAYTVAAWMVAVFTFWGVNAFASGLHSYA